MNNQPSIITFGDNSLLSILYGKHDQHLLKLEKVFDVKIFCRGNFVEVNGSTKSKLATCKVLEILYERIKSGFDVGLGDVEGAIKVIQDQLFKAEENFTNDVIIKTTKRKIIPRSSNQQKYIKEIENHDLVFALGPAGTGKTYLAVAVAVSCLIRGEVDRIILSRPAVEAGERLGFLPGDLKDKVDPYLRPLYDALYDMLPADVVFRRLERGEIEVAPLAFMRGRTLSNAFIIVDEAQNTTPMQMKMLLTRLGENARMVVTGDLSQIDLSVGQVSGLKEASNILQDVEGVSFAKFDARDVVRNSLVTKMVVAYEIFEDKKKKKT